MCLRLRINVAIVILTDSELVAEWSRSACEHRRGPQTSTGPAGGQEDASRGDFSASPADGGRRETCSQSPGRIGTHTFNMEY